LHPRAHPFNFEVPSEGLYFQRVVDTARIPSITCQKRGSHTVDAGVKTAAAIQFVMHLRGMTLLAAFSLLCSLTESGNRCAARSCQSDLTLEARTDRSVKLSASSYFEEKRTLI
jgi:hypothetical protein